MNMIEKDNRRFDNALKGILGNALARAGCTVSFFGAQLFVILLGLLRKYGTLL